MIAQLIHLGITPDSVLFVDAIRYFSHKEEIYEEKKEFWKVVAAEALNG